MSRKPGRIIRSVESGSRRLARGVFGFSRSRGITHKGIQDISNDMGAFMIVRADSHEAAAKLFEQHPHFTIFPGESVEVMPVLPIPSV
jgi:hypothetical protein